MMAIEVMLAAATEATNHWTEIGMVVGGIVLVLTGGKAGAVVQKRRANGNGDTRTRGPCPLHKPLEDEVKQTREAVEGVDQKVTKIMFHLMGGPKE